MSQATASAKEAATFVSVIIPNWNGQSQLARCLAMLGTRFDEAAAVVDAPGASRRPGYPEGSQRGLALQVIVVDDASTDDSTAMVRSEHPSVVLIEHAANRGFAASCNDGAGVANGEWLLFLNSDAFVDGVRVESLVRTAEGLDASALGPQLLFEDGSPQDSGGMFPTPWAITLTKLGRLFGRDLPGASHRRRVEAATPCKWVAGACMLVRARVFRAAGGFDERLTYLEDVELGRRIADDRGRLFLTDTVAVTHVGGASFRLIAPRVPQLYRESQRLLARAYMSKWQRTVIGAALAVEGVMRAVLVRLQPR